MEQYGVPRLSEHEAGQSHDEVDEFNTLVNCIDRVRMAYTIGRCRDDLDKYWSDTIWQRKAQDREIWRRHAEAFAQPRDTTAA